ncbi:MAG TPA: hypothetical protein IAC62_12265 [Candidatus Pelethocola excrementipullorum]|nr:hypothetical protein [Candidatus Pelethocola excrementipullorum]
MEQVKAKMVLKAKILSAGILIFLVVLCSLLIGEVKKSEKDYEILALNSEGEITEDFIQQVAKLEGVNCVSGVMGVPVQLKINGYERDVILKGIDLDTYPLHIKDCEENLQLGSQIPLFLGGGSLDGFLDHNGQAITEKVKKDLLHRGIGMEIEIREVDPGTDPESPSNSVFTKRAGIWAAVIRGNADEIYISMEDGKKLVENLGLEGQVNEVYIMIRGKTNYQDVKRSLETSGLTVNKIG